MPCVGDDSGRPRQQRLHFRVAFRRQSHPIKAEVERVLATKFAWPVERIARAAEQLWSFSRNVATRQTVTDCADPDDNRVLECALDGHATVIVTGDAHLLKLHPYRNIPILKPKQFLDSEPWEKR
jgi:putative PIN family toxin of toxin-antitoxin system